MSCVLCQPLEEHEVFATDLRRVIVNLNQNKLGKLMVCLMRHDEDIRALTDSEPPELRDVIRKTNGISDPLFRPDRYSHSFSMNLDPHVRLHIIPRYDTPRVFEGADSHDSDDIAENRLSREAHNRLVQSLRESSSNLA